MAEKKEELSKEELAEQLKLYQKKVAELERSELRYKRLIEELKDVVMRVTPDGILEYCGPGIREFGSYEASEEVGLSISKFFTKRVEFSRLLQIFKIALADREPAVFEFLFMPKYKRPFPVELSVMPVSTGETDEITSFQCVIRDISERRQAEREKQRLEEKIIQFEKMEAIGRLAGGIAHDLNNVLSPVVGYPDLLVTKLPEESEVLKPLLTIKRSGEKAAEIVEDLLTLARKGVRTRKVLNLNEIVRGFLKSQDYEKFQHVYPTVTIETSLEEDLHNINGSREHLLKALSNLVFNAAETMPDGGTISISTLNLYPTKTASELELEDYVVMMVADNGMGFGIEHRDRIFEPFYTRKIMGRNTSGLSMAVVWGTLQDHDGYINFGSRKGKGSTFELYFPVTTVREVSDVEVKPVSLDRYLGNGEKVLVVDDGEEQREVTSSLLERLGYNVETVKSGEEAIEYCRKSRGYFNLVLLDMIMGDGMDGLDTYKKMKQLCPETKTLIVSGYSETERVKEAQRLGAGEYIRKPCTIEKLGLAVKQALKG